jgi:DNA processing protein
VVEAGETSGALITADCALNQGRDVLAVPGLATNPLARGSNRLLQEGAGLVESAVDVLAELAWGVLTSRLKWRPKRAGPVANGSAPLPAGLSVVEARLLGCLEGEGRLEDLAQVTGLMAGEVAAALTELELRGLVRRMPGDVFRRVEGF